MITWKHYERLLGGTIAARLADIPTKGQVLRLADASNWGEFVSLISAIKGFSEVEENATVANIIVLAKKHVNSEIDDYFKVVTDERPISLAMFPDWFVKDKDMLTLEDMIYATRMLWDILSDFNDRYLTSEYEEWYRYLLLFLYKRAYQYKWENATVRNLFANMPMGDRISVMLERGEAEPKQVASVLGISPDMGDMDILELEVFLDEYILLKLSGLAMSSNPLYEIVFYYRALDTSYRNIQVVATGIWGGLPREEIIKRVREVYV